MRCELMWWASLQQNVACSEIERLRLWWVHFAIAVAFLTTHPTTQRQMTGDLNCQLLLCGNLKILITSIVSVQCLPCSRTRGIRMLSLRIIVAKWPTHLDAPEAHLCMKQMSHWKRPVWWRPVPLLMLSLHSVRTYSCKHSQSLSFVQQKTPTARFRTRRWPSGCLSHVLSLYVSVESSRL
jgi:hypothetical protein